MLLIAAHPLPSADVGQAIEFTITYSLALIHVADPSSVSWLLQKALCGEWELCCRVSAVELPEDLLTKLLEGEGDVQDRFDIQPAGKMRTVNTLYKRSRRSLLRKACE